MNRMLIILLLATVSTAAGQAVDFDTEIQPIFDQNCVVCHGGISTNAGLNLSATRSYDNLVEVTSQNYAPALRVASGEPESSVIYHKTNYTGLYGGGMPPTGQMPQENLDLIEQWIIQLASTAVEPEGTVAADDFYLGENFPNPFNPGTTIRFRLPEVVSVRLEIYDIRGQAVRTLVNSRLDVGEYSLVWDGREETGNKVGSGVYFYRLDIENRSFARKMLLLR